MKACWQVPDSCHNVFDRKKTRFCTVIPVINEGERIRRQLSTMHRLNVPQMTDLILVDGGSTDGSVPDDFLLSKGVRTKITKQGPGKLSAQLRLGYAYALTEGYDGVVTMDGNDKDGPEAITAFIAALSEGVDFVQGSRFVTGGQAINTPWSRWLAIRLIHAPLISLAACHHFTDTTSGYRAYSRKFLLDPRVMPLRDVFSSYELLFYLSVRAPRLGFVCREIPVERRYPAGKPPTKISFWRGNVEVLKNLLQAVTGQFDPPENQS